jgi:hypothetical protein
MWYNIQTNKRVWFFLNKIVCIHVPDWRWGAFTTIHLECKTTGWWNLKKQMHITIKMVAGQRLFQWTTQDEYKPQELRLSDKCVMYTCEGIYVTLTSTWSASKTKRSLHIFTTESCLRWKESYPCAMWSTAPCILILSIIWRWVASFSLQPPYLQGPLVPNEKKTWVWTLWITEEPRHLCRKSNYTSLVSQPVTWSLHVLGQPACNLVTTLPWSASL